MKSKFKFFGIVALISVAAFTVQSCAKDFSEDIDDIKAQLAAAQASITSLQGAINGGKLVKTVTPVTNGYTITFSDNSTITILNGATGPAGTPGQTGPAGFTPIIGIDAQGYWTVVASQGAAATRILVGGQPVLAKVTAQNLTLGTDNYLYVDGVKSSVYIPNIYYNSVDRTLSVWIYTSGTLTEYKLPLANDVVLQSDIVGLVAPVSAPATLLNYGMVTETGATSTAQFGWAGVTANQLLYGSAKVPVIVNPANATVAGYTFEIINVNGDPIALQGTLTPGWTGDFVQYTAGENGLYTLTLNPTAANITAFKTAYTTGIANQLAIRASKNSRNIVSGYQYSIKVAQAASVTLPAANATNYEPLPANAVNVFKYFPAIGGATTATTKQEKFYVSEAVVKSAGTDANIAPFVVVSAKSPLVTVANGGTIEDINDNDRQVTYTLKTMDFTGLYQTQDVVVHYFTPLSLTPNTISYPVSYQIGQTNTYVTVSLASLMTALDNERKLELFRNTATNLQVTQLPSGVAYQFLDGTGTALAAVNTPVAAGNVASVKFVFTNSSCDDGTFTSGVNLPKLTFTDSRGVNYSNNYTAFSVTFPMTITNPDLTALIAGLTHTPPPVWDAATNSIITLVGDNSSQYYTLTNAWTNLNTITAAGHTYTYKIVQPTTPVSEVALGSNRYYYETTPYNRVQTTRSVKLYINVAGNTANQVPAETFGVQVLSEITNGTIVATQTSGVDNFLTVTHGDQSGSAWKYFHNVYSLRDYFNSAVEAFDADNADSRLAAYGSNNDGAIRIVATGPNASLIQIEQYDYTGLGTDHLYRFRVRSAYSFNDPILTVSSVDIPVDITVYDDFGKTLVKHVFVRLVKP